MNLATDDIKHIAKLARLELSEKELALYSSQLKDILGYIGQLNEVDTGTIEPTARLTDAANVLREDKIADWPADEKDLAIKQAPEAEDGYVRVKRILE